MERVKARHGFLVRKIPSVRLEPGSVPDGTTVTIGSVSYELGTKLLVDPGKVEVDAAAPGYVSRHVSYELADGEQRVLTIVLTPIAPPASTPPEAPASAAAAVAAPAPAPPAPLPSPLARSGTWRTFGFIALGVGGAGLAAGAVTGVLALGHAKDVEAACPTKTTCSEGGAAAARSGSTESTISTIATIGGGAVVLAGLALVIWGGPKASVRPTVGAMNGLVLSGEL